MYTLCAVRVESPTLRRLNMLDLHKRPPSLFGTLSYFDGKDYDTGDDFWRLREHHKHLVCPGLAADVREYAFEMEREAKAAGPKWVPPFNMSQDVKGIRQPVVAHCAFQM